MSNSQRLGMLPLSGLIVVLVLGIHPAGQAGFSNQTATVFPYGMDSTLKKVGWGDDFNMDGVPITALSIFFSRRRIRFLHVMVDVTDKGGGIQFRSQ